MQLGEGIHSPDSCAPQRFMMASGNKRAESTQHSREAVQASARAEMRGSPLH